MPCYYPLKAFYRMVDGKKDIQFCNCQDDLKASSIFRNGVLYKDKIEIPCGQCIGCRLEYSRQWAVRCVLESKMFKDNYFLTLTYDEDHLPSARHCLTDPDTGEVVKDFVSHSLVPDDLKKFVKDLRRYYKYHFDLDDIRFFACGEYGEKNGRPHYHAIFFNLPIPDLQESKTLFSHSGFPFFESPTLAKIWKKGLVGIGDLTFESCAYTARYILKKHKGLDSNYYDDNGLLPEFTRMSRCPGIGATYFEDKKEKIYKYDSVYITNSSGEVLTVKPPHYYDRLFDIVDSDRLTSLKSARMDFASNNKKMLKRRSSLDYDDYLHKCEDIKIHKIAALDRQVEK